MILFIPSSRCLRQAAAIHRSRKRAKMFIPSLSIVFSYAIINALISLVSPQPHIGHAVCGNPPVPAHSQIQFTEYPPKLGTNVTYICDPGYNILGLTERTCVGTGEWNGLTPICVVDVARRNPTKSSSQMSLASPALVVEGTEVSDLSDRSCHRTRPARNNWWSVNFLQPHVIHAVRFTIGQGCCGNEEVVLEIKIGNDRDINKNSLCARYKGRIKSGTALEVRCYRPLRGMYLSLHQSSEVSLSLSLCRLAALSDDAMPAEQCPFLPGERPWEIRTFDNNCYHFITNRHESFGNAIEFCRRLGGNLVHHTSPAFQGFVSWIFANREDLLYAPVQDYWMGSIRSPSTEWKWMWVENGKPFDHVNTLRSFWATRLPPNNHQGIKDCSMYEADSGWLWREEDCSRPLNFVCETGPMHCGSPSMHENTTVDYESAEISQIAKYRCQVGGSTLKGGEERECKNDGQWSSRPPMCSVDTLGEVIVDDNVDCGMPPLISHSQIFYTGSKLGDKATFKCDKGFALSTLTQLQCQADSTWGPKVPSCEPIDCGDPPQISDATASLPSRETGYGSTARYYCDKGFEPVGPDRLICDENGKWQGVRVRCIPVGLSDFEKFTTPAHVKYEILNEPISGVDKNAALPQWPFDSIDQPVVVDHQDRFEADDNLHAGTKATTEGSILTNEPDQALTGKISLPAGNKFNPDSWSDDRVPETTKAMEGKDMYEASTVQPDTGSFLFSDEPVKTTSGSDSTLRVPSSTETPWFKEFLNENGDPAISSQNMPDYSQMHDELFPTGPIDFNFESDPIKTDSSEFAWPNFLTDPSDTDLSEHKKLSPITVTDDYEYQAETPDLSTDSSSQSAPPSSTLESTSKTGPSSSRYPSTSLSTSTSETIPSTSGSSSTADSTSKTIPSTYDSTLRTDPSTALSSELPGSTSKTVPSTSDSTLKTIPSTYASTSTSDSTNKTIPSTDLTSKEDPTTSGSPSTSDSTTKTTSGSTGKSVPSTSGSSSSSGLPSTSDSTYGTPYSGDTTSGSTGKSVPSTSGSSSSSGLPSTSDSTSKSVPSTSGSSSSSGLPSTSDSTYGSPYSGDTTSGSSPSSGLSSTSDSTSKSVPSTYGSSSSSGLPLTSDSTYGSPYSGDTTSGFPSTSEAGSPTLGFPGNFDFGIPEQTTLDSVNFGKLDSPNESPGYTPNLNGETDYTGTFPSTTFESTSEGKASTYDSTSNKPKSSSPLTYSSTGDIYPSTEEDLLTFPSTTFESTSEGKVPTYDSTSNTPKSSSPLTYSSTGDIYPSTEEDLHLGTYEVIKPTANDDMPDAVRLRTTPEPVAWTARTPDDFFELEYSVASSSPSGEGKETGTERPATETTTIGTWRATDSENLDASSTQGEFLFDKNDFGTPDDMFFTVENKLIKNEAKTKLDSPQEDFTFSNSYLPSDTLIPQTETSDAPSNGEFTDDYNFKFPNAQSGSAKKAGEFFELEALAPIKTQTTSKPEFSSTPHVETKLVTNEDGYEVSKTLEPNTPVTDEPSYELDFEVDYETTALPEAKDDSVHFPIVPPVVNEFPNEYHTNLFPIEPVPTDQSNSGELEERVQVPIGVLPGLSDYDISRNPAGSSSGNDYYNVDETLYASRGRNRTNVTITDFERVGSGDDELRAGNMDIVVSVTPKPVQAKSMTEYIALAVVLGVVLIVASGLCVACILRRRRRHSQRARLNHHYPEDVDGRIIRHGSAWDNAAASIASRGSKATRSDYPSVRSMGLPPVRKDSDSNSDVSRGARTVGTIEAPQNLDEIQIHDVKDPYHRYPPSLGQSTFKSDRSSHR